MRYANYSLLLVALLLCLSLLTACGGNREFSTEASATLPVLQQPTLTDPLQSSLPEAPTTGGSVEALSGKYCVMGVTGRTYPEYTALQFDFENSVFDFGLPTITSSWIRRGELKVEGSRITAVCDTPKTAFVGNELVYEGYFTWSFALEPDGSLRFVPEGSDPFEVYGTQLNADSTLLRTGELEKPLN